MYAAEWKHAPMGKLCDGLISEFYRVTEKINVYNIEGPCWGLKSDKS